jgi:hypothetical protein
MVRAIAMLYRCQACHHEEARGCMPIALSLLPPMFFFGLSCSGVTAAALRVLTVAHERSPPDFNPDEVPWWYPITVWGILIVLSVVGAVALHYLAKTLEYLIVARRPCPKCGASRWSWGYEGGGFGGL